MVLPISGSSPLMAEAGAITNFSSGFIASHALSRDGKRIALSLGHQTDDVVLD